MTIPSRQSSTILTPMGARLLAALVLLAFTLVITRSMPMGSAGDSVALPFPHARR